MASFFIHARRFFLLLLLAALALCLLGMYQLVQTMNRTLMGAETYTCREFTYDMEQHDTDKYGAMLVATFAYGVNPEGTTNPPDRQAEISNHGMFTATSKIYALCKGQQPSARIFGLVAQSITGISTTTPLPVSSTAVVSGTTLTSPTNTK